MCISMAPAKFENAIVFAGEVDESTHLMGYQNTAESFAGPNCMLLHVPTDTLSPDSLVPARAGAGKFLSAMGRQARSLRPQTRGGFATRGFDQPIGASFSFVVKYGAYEVVLTSSAAAIRDALEEVSYDKRPWVNQQLLDWYDREYPDCSFVLACFNDVVDAADDPIVLRYTPQDPTKLFAPGLESHDGRPPRLGARDHDRDFKVVFGSRLADEGAEWNHFDDVWLDETLQQLLPRRVVGFRDENYGTNSDYVANVTDVRAGVDHADLFRTMEEHVTGSPLGRR